MSFARNFAAGQRIASDLLDTYEKGKLRSDLGKVFAEKPEDLQGFTTEHMDQLRQAGESGQSDIGYDEARRGYTVTPKAGGEASFIPMQPVTDFLGKRTAGTMNESQVNAARMRSVADILGARDPVAGLQMRRQLERDERDDQRFAWERSRTEREERTATQKESDDQLTRGIDAEIGKAMEQRLVQKDGTQRPMTVDDYLYGSQMRAARLLAAGKSNEAGQAIKDYQAQSLAKIQLETAQRNEALGQAVAALNAGDFSKVRDFYNAYVPDGMRVTDVVPDQKTGSITIQRMTADGRPVPDTVIKDTGQLTAALSTFKDPMAVYNWSQNEFQNSLRSKADKRADEQLQLSKNAANRAETAASDASAAKKEKVAAALALAEEQSQAKNGSPLTPAQRRAIQAGVINPFPGTDKNAPSEVRLAQAAVEAELHKDMASALEWARSSAGKPLDEIRAGIFQNAMKRHFGSVPAATRETDAAMEYLRRASQPAGAPSPQPPDARAAAAQNPPAQPPIPAAGQRRNDDGSISGRIGPPPKRPDNITAQDIAATAKKYGITEAEVRRRLNLQ